MRKYNYIKKKNTQLFKGLNMISFLHNNHTRHPMKHGVPLMYFKSDTPCGGVSFACFSITYVLL